jgi:hypothetical protein
VEQARIHNEVSKHPFQEMQLITFLNSCLSGTPNLSQVLTLHQTAKKAAGITTDIKMAEYVAILLDQAQVHDAGNTHSTNPRARRSVNTHEFVFEDSNPNDYGDTYEVFKTEIHDHETPIELLVNRTEQGPRRPRVDSNTWHSLSKDDQIAWDTVSDQGKSAILTYASKNSSKFGNHNGILRNSEKKTRFANDFKSRQANTHEQSPTTQDTETTNEDTSNTTIEVSTHQLLPKPTHTNDFDDILTMATTKTTSESAPNAHLTINSIMSTPTLLGNTHETHYERTDYGLEAFVHKVKIGDFEYEVESDHDDDFSDVDDTKLDKFDYSAYRENPTPTQIDLLDEASFLVDRDQLNPEPQSNEIPTSVRLETKEDLIKFHEDPEAEATEFPRVQTPTIEESTFEDIEESIPTTNYFDLSRYVIHRNDEPLDLTKHLLEEEPLVIDDALLDEVSAKLSVEESKDYEQPYQGLQGMMKSPFQFVTKPPPTVSKIILNEDKTKHIFIKDTDELPRLEAIPPTTHDSDITDEYTTDEGPETATEPFDFSKYIDHPEYIDDPNPFIDDPSIPSDEPKFYEKPSVDTDLEENDDSIWKVATKRKRKKKVSLSTKPAVPSPSSNSSPSSQSDSSSVVHPKKDFRYAGSD